MQRPGWSAPILYLLIALALAGPAAGQGADLKADTVDARTFVPPTAEAAKRSGVRQARFEITFENVPGEAQAAIRFAAGLWEAHLDSSVPITVRVAFERLSNGTLGSTSPNLVSFDDPADTDGLLDANVWYPTALAEAVLGRNVNGDRVEITTSLSSAVPWYFGTDGQTPAGSYDLVTVALHELGHGLGFTSSFRVDQSGSDGASCPGAPAGWGCWGFDFGLSNVDPPGYFFVFDPFVEDEREIPLLDAATFANPSAALGEALQSDRLRFDAPTTRRVNGEIPIDLYAPSNFETGSSISHLDENAFPAGDPNSLMTPNLARAEAVFSPGPILCALFQDLGWPLGSACTALLPSALVTLEAAADGDDVVLTLQTPDAAVLRSVDIQQSLDDAPFRTLVALSGDNLPRRGETLTLRLEDLAPGDYAFRLRQVDGWGAVSFSPEIEVTIDLSTPYFLSETFPNPFAVRAYWDLLVETGQTVTAVVYDVAGRPAAPVYDGFAAPGERLRLSFDANDLAPGLYLLRVHGETFTATRTGVLAR